MLKSFVELIKDRLSVSSIIGKNVILKKRGKDFWGICPFHKESTPSFSVNDEKKFYHCFGCGMHGDIFTFLTEFHHFTFLESLKVLAQIANVSLPENTKKEYEDYEIVQQVLSNASEWFIQNLHCEYKEIILIPFTKRVSLNYIKKFSIGYAPQFGLKQYLKSLKFTEEHMDKAGLLDVNKNDYFKDRIIFPIFNYANKVVGFGGRVSDYKLHNLSNSVKYLNSKETVFFKKNEILYGIEIAKRFCKESLIIVEGYIDVIALHQNGIKNAVGILGTAFTANHFNKIISMTNNIIFCFDGDNAGKKAINRTIKTLLGIIDTDIKIKFIFLNSGDPEDYLRSNGALLFKKLIDESIILSQALWNILIEENPLMNPEHYFELEKKITEYTELITNKDLKKYYLSFLKNKIYQLRFNNKKNLKNKSVLKQHVGNNTSNLELMLKLTLNYPEILNHYDIYEEFSILEINDDLLKHVQQHIIEHYNNSDNISTNSLKQYLLHNNIELEKIININLNMYGIINKNIALITWKKFILNLEIDKLKIEYQELLKNIMNDQNVEKKINSIVDKIKELQMEIENMNFDNCS